MTYTVEYEKKVIKDLKKLDKPQQKLLLSWVENNLVNTDNSSQHGKALKGGLKGYWRYRVGKYRLIADIDDDKVRISVIRIAHRKVIYK